jgi:hypothetical protein
MSADQVLKIVQQLFFVCDRTSGSDPTVVGIPALVQKGFGLTEGIGGAKHDHDKPMPIDEAAAVWLLIN